MSRLYARESEYARARERENGGVRERERARTRERKGRDRERDSARVIEDSGEIAIVKTGEIVLFWLLVVRELPPQVYLAESVYIIVLQKSIPAQTRRLIIHFQQYTERVA